MALILWNRQTSTYDDDDYDGDDPYWAYSPTAEAIKWSIVVAIILLFVLWFVGGYYHAQRRIRKGLRPLPYHIYLIPRRQRLQYIDPPQGYHPNAPEYAQSYPMQAYPPPPPAYTAEHNPPPQYQPPEGATKVNPHQDWAAPPQGAPPTQNSSPGETSSSSRPEYTIFDISNPTSSGDDLPARPQKKQGFMARMNPFK